MKRSDAKIIAKKKKKTEESSGSEDSIELNDDWENQEKMRKKT